MAIVLEKVYEGLGNQLFGVVSTIALAKEHDMGFILPVDQSVSPSAIKIPCYWKTALQGIVAKMAAPDRPWPKVSLPGLSAMQYAPLKPQPECYNLLSGLFQNYRHFHNQRKYISELFSEESKRYDLPSDISSEGEIVVIGARRYKRDRTQNMASPLDFYRDAFKKMEENGKVNLKTCKFWVFGDDLLWIQDVLKRYWPEYHSRSQYFLGMNDGETDVKHFYWMIRYADHFIVPWTTFHYWAAYLNDKNQNKQVVMHRNQYTSYIIPPEWLTVDVLFRG